ncbi:MAG: NAD(P)H-hydrate epimerase [Candidatus Omnitrophica bacterium]|nr:NAD(P)H-hydrate epimerase [Candidatus Omnitrophota bacterium]
MKELDSMAASKGLSTAFLMENAGRAVADKSLEVSAQDKGKTFLIFCGKGNNGGDGLACARILKEKGSRVAVYLVDKEWEFAGLAHANLRLYRDAGGHADEINPPDTARMNEVLKEGLVIDAIFGTGFQGSVGGIHKNIIELLNSSNLPILSVDVPSGLNATTGEVKPVAIKAKWTVTFALPKKGFYINEGPSHVGEIRIVNIGFPPELIDKAIEYEKTHV